MSSLYELRVMACQHTQLQVEVQIHNEILQHLPRTKAFFLGALWEQLNEEIRPAYPLADSLSQEDLDDPAWLQAHVKDFIHSIRLLRIRRRRGIYSVRVKDPSWIAHLRPGERWRTHFYELCSDEFSFHPWRPARIQPDGLAHSLRTGLIDVFEAVRLGLPAHLLHHFACDCARYLLICKRLHDKELERSLLKALQAKQAWIEGQIDDDALDMARRQLDRDAVPLAMLQPVNTISLAHIVDKAMDEDPLYAALDTAWFCAERLANDTILTWQQQRLAQRLDEMQEQHRGLCRLLRRQSQQRRLQRQHEQLESMLFHTEAPSFAQIHTPDENDTLT